MSCDFMTPPSRHLVRQIWGRWAKMHNSDKKISVGDGALLQLSYEHFRETSRCLIEGTMQVRLIWRSRSIQYKCKKVTQSIVAHVCRGQRVKWNYIWLEMLVRSTIYVDIVNWDNMISYFTKVKRIYETRSGGK